MVQTPSQIPDTPPGWLPPDSTTSKPGQSGALGNTPDLYNINPQILSGGIGGPPSYHYTREGIGPGVWRWEIICYEFRGGLNKQAGDYNRDFDRLSSSTLWTPSPRTVCLPPLTSATATPDPTGNLVGLHHARIFDTLIMGMGSGANVSLIKETSATDPTPTAITFSPASAITCLTPVVANNVLTAKQLLIGRAGAVPVLHTDAAGSASGTAYHADFNPTWGAIQTFINNDLILYYANAAIRVQEKTALISAAPVVTLASIPNGGKAIGLHKLGGSPVRAYWWSPETSNTTGGLTQGSEARGYVWSTNAEGFDPVPLNLSPFLNYVACADIYRHGIIATDGERLVWHTGDGILDMAIFEDMPADSNFVYRIRGWWTRSGNDLYVRTSKSVATGGSGSALLQTFYFDPDTLAWHQVSATVTSDDSILPGQGGLPWSDQTGYLHSYEEGSWRRMKTPPPGVNPYGLRKTAGAAATTGFPYAASGILTSTSWELPGLEGKPKEVVGCEFMGNLEAGSPTDATTPASVAIAVKNVLGDFVTIASFGPNHTFIGVSEQAGERERPLIDKLQVRVTATQASGGTDPTLYTMNCVPFKLWGYAYDEEEAPPLSVMPRMPRR